MSSMNDDRIGKVKRNKISSIRLMAAKWHAKASNHVMKSCDDNDWLAV